jgi:hypothetical protein
MEQGGFCPGERVLTELKLFRKVLGERSFPDKILYLSTSDDERIYLYSKKDLPKILVVDDEKEKEGTKNDLNDIL